MPAFQGLQVPRVEALRPERDAVDARRGKRARDGIVHRLGVRLDGPLRARRKRHALPHGPQCAPEERRRQERRRPAAHEDRVKRCAHPRRQRPELFLEPHDECLLAILGVDEAVEVAVMALVEAERHVDVQALESRLDPGERIGRRRRRGGTRSLPEDVERRSHERRPS
jgi:hypothetical protein